MNNFMFILVIALCGTRISSLNIDAANRVMGATPAGEGSFRYMISLQQLSQLASFTRGHRCGGALVSLRHAVTTATCLSEPNGAIINPAEYRVFAGATVLTNDASADRHRRIERLTIHPNYTITNPIVNNIAVITLVSAFPSNAVSTVPLSDNDVTVLNGPICQSSGWVGTQLMYTTKYVPTQPECQSFFAGMPGFPTLTIQSSMICATPTTISSSCAGELGNPLVCRGYLHGLQLMNAYDCSNTANYGPRPEVYTRISTFRSWINTTAGASTFQPGMAVLALISIVQLLNTKVFT